LGGFACSGASYDVQGKRRSPESRDLAVFAQFLFSKKRDKRKKKKEKKRKKKKEKLLTPCSPLIEISYVAGKLEVLWEDESFPGRQLSALVASKVFFYLEDYKNSVIFALRAGSLFDVGSGLPGSRTEYVDTIVAKVMDEYTRLRIHNAEQKAQEAIPSGLEDIVNRMLERCFEDKEYTQALGLGIETRRLDVMERAIRASNDIPGIIAYSVITARRLVNNREWRRQILARIVEIHSSLENPNYVAVFDVLVHLDDWDSVSKTLVAVVKDKPLVAFQLAFDLCAR
jgi:26S proteasome regulatory subunit N2